MSNFFGINLKNIRKSNGISQSQLALQLGKGQKTIGNWETGFSEPNTSELIRISNLFGISLDNLLKAELKNVEGNEEVSQKDDSKNVVGNVEPHVEVNPENEILSVSADPATTTNLPKVVTIDSQGNENIIYVPVKARAGYLQGYGDPEFIAKLPAYRLPGITGGSFRMFEVQGHSMFPTFSDKDRVVCRAETIENIKDDRNYVIVTKSDGILVKRVLNRWKTGIIICKSDHNLSGEYPPIILDIHDIAEVWYITVRMTNQMQGPGEIHQRMADLEADVILLKETLLKGRLNAL